MMLAGQYPTKQPLTMGAYRQRGDGSLCAVGSVKTPASACEVLQLCLAAQVRFEAAET